MTREKKRLVLAILVIALMQMPGQALTPGINQIRTTAFSGYSLGLVQTALALTGLMQPFAAIFAAVLVNKGKVTKKSVILFGLCLLAANGVLAMILNTEFWHLMLLSMILGISTGCFISNVFGVLVDCFEPAERQNIAGYQSAVINVGGIIMGLMGGLLATYMWYGGYLILLIGLPAAILVFINIPNYRTETGNGVNAGALKMLNPKIYYYCIVAFLYMMAYTVCGNNISTHIADIGDSSTAGVAVAFLMGGGVASGFFFSKLSDKIGDYSLTCGLCAMGVGYFTLSLFPSSLFITFAAVFVVGMSLSIYFPRCIYMVSTLAGNPSEATTATALISIVAPSLGAFTSPIIVTNLTTALFGESTVARYRFMSLIVVVYAVIIAIITTYWKKNGSESSKEPKVA